VLNDICPKPNIPQDEPSGLAASRRKTFKNRADIAEVYFANKPWTSTIHLSKSIRRTQALRPVLARFPRVRASQPFDKLRADWSELKRLRQVFFSLWVALPHCCDPSGRGRLYCGVRYRVVGVIKPKSSFLKFVPVHYVAIRVRVRNNTLFSRRVKPCRLNFYFSVSPCKLANNSSASRSHHMGPAKNL